MLIVILLFLVNIFWIHKSTSLPFFSCLQIANIYILVSVNLSFAMSEYFSGSYVFIIPSFDSLLLCNFSLALINIIYWSIPLKKAKSSGLPTHQNNFYFKFHTYAYYLVVIIAIYGIISTISMSNLSALGEFDAFLRRSSTVTLFARIKSLLFSINGVIAFLSILILAIPKKKSIYDSLLNSLIIVYLLSSAFVGGGRSLLVFYIAGILSIYPWFRNLFQDKIKLLVLIPTIGSVIVALSGFMIYIRYAAQGAKASFDLNLGNIIKASTTGLSIIDHFELARYLSEKNIELIQPQYFGRFIDFIILFLSGIVPRSIWENKPIQIAREIRYELFGDTNGGVPIGFLGEGYYLGGIVLLFLFVAIYSFFLKGVDCYIQSGNKQFINRARSVIIVPLVTYALLRGGLDNFLFRSLAPIIMYVLSEKIFLRYFSLIGKIKFTS